MIQSGISFASLQVLQCLVEVFLQGFYPLLMVVVMHMPSSLTVF